MTQLTYRRASGVVWRALADRVLVHRVGASPEEAAAELRGPVALVWIALDEPATVTAIRARLTEASVGVDDVGVELGRLIAEGWVDAVDVEAVDGQPPQARSAEVPAVIGHLGIQGTTVALSASSPLRDELLAALADLLVEGAAVDAGPVESSGRVDRLDAHLYGDIWRVRWNGEDRYVGPSIDLALYDSLIALNQHASHTASAAGCAVLHGGAVEIAGRATVVVGHSGAGKSTLTAALARRGHPYLADEVVAIRDDRVVEEFHRPIGLRWGGAAALGIAIPDGPYSRVMPWRVGPNLGGACPLGLVAILERSDTPEPARLLSLSPSEALVELANQTLGVAGDERAMFRRLDAVVRTARVVRLAYSDLDDAAAALERESVALARDVESP